jgi:hypothetical protein
MLKYLENLDILGSEPKLKVQSASKFKSFLGGLFSLIIILSSTAISLYFTHETILRKNYTVIYNQNTNFQGNMTVDNHPFAFGMYVDSAVLPLDSTIIKYRAMYLTLKGIDFQSEEIPMKPCKEQNFKSLLNLVQESYLNFMPYMFCLDPEYTKIRPIFGYRGGTEYGSKVYRIYAMRCQNSTNSDIICASPEEIENKIQKAVQVVTFFDTIIDHSNPKTPGKKYFRAITNKMNSLYYSEYMINIRGIDYQSDFGALLNNYETDQYFTLEDFKMNLGVPETADFPNTFGLNTLTMSSMKEVYIRRFDKLQNLLANVGSVVKFLLLIGNIAEKIWLRPFYHQYLFKHLYTSKNLIKEHEKRDSMSLRKTSNFNNFNNNSLKLENYEDISMRNLKISVSHKHK